MTIKTVIFIILFGLLIYANALGGEFVWDDNSFVADNTSIRTLGNFIRFFSDPSSAAVGELSGDVYRPVTTLSYTFDYLFWKSNPFGYHLTNILFHALNAALVFILFLLISKDRLTALASSLIFVSHPVQTEAVAWISGRSNVLFLFFYLASLILYIRSLTDKGRAAYRLSLLAFAISLFSKEMALTLPLIMIAYEIHFNREQPVKRAFLRCIPHILLGAFYIVTRTVLLKKIGQFSGWGGGLDFILTMVKVVADYIRLLFFPVRLCAVGYPVPLAESLRDPKTLLAAALLFSIFAGIPFIFRRSRIGSFSVSWFFITLLPVLNIIPIKALEAERFLYLPSIGFCGMAASFVSFLAKRFDKPIMKNIRIVPLIMALIIAAYSVKTVSRNEVWKDEIAISAETVRVSPQSAWALTALGANYIERGNYRGAVKYLEKAVKIADGYGAAHNALGKCYLGLGRYEEAIPEFRKAIELDPETVGTRNLLGVTYANLTRY